MTVNANWNSNGYWLQAWTDPRAGMQGVNDLIAVEPFPKAGAPTQVTKSGFTTDRRKGSLVALKVVHGNPDFPDGCTIYTKSDNDIQPWAKEVFELNGHPFIMIPKSFILLRDYVLPSSTYPAMTYTVVDPVPVRYTYPVYGSETGVGGFELQSDGTWKKKE